MTKEDIEKAAYKYSVNQDTFSHIAGLTAITIHDLNRASKVGFESGAEWRINSVWHDASEKPELNEFFVYCDENNQYETDCFYKTPKWKVYVAENNLVRWAYMKDLIPNI